MMHRLAVAVAVLAALAALTAAAAFGAAKASPQDQTWLKTSAEGDAFEIAGGKLALRSGSSAKVRTLARRLIEDHSKSLSETKATAAKLGVEVEGKPSPSQQWELQVLATMKGVRFDRWYSKLEVLDHEQDIQETSDEAKTGSAPQAIKLAKQDLPMLRMHLKLSKAARAAS